MKSKIFVFALLLLGLSFLAVGCGQAKKSATPDQSGAPAVNPAASQTADQTTKKDCQGDSACFAAEFSKCQPSEFKTSFGPGGTYIITVFGLENGKCHYQGGVYGSDGKLLTPGLECNLPPAEISSDTFGHFFGQDKSPGQETIRAKQDKLQQDYCVTKN